MTQFKSNISLQLDRVSISYNWIGSLVIILKKFLSSNFFNDVLHVKDLSYTKLTYFLCITIYIFVRYKLSNLYSINPTTIRMTGTDIVKLDTI